MFAHPGVSMSRESLAAQLKLILQVVLLPLVWISLAAKRGSVQVNKPENRQKKEAEETPAD